MNSNQMKNIIVLKNLPSNLIDEAFIILKDNKNAKLLEKIEKQNNGKSEEYKTGDCIIKEAEMVVSNYLSKLDEEKKYRNYSIKKIENKYKKLKALTIVLSAIVIINVILTL